MGAGGFAAPGCGRLNAVCAKTTEVVSRDLVEEALPYS